jgi:hypothetical protein
MKRVHIAATRRDMDRVAVEKLRTNRVSNVETAMRTTSGSDFGTKVLKISKLFLESHINVPVTVIWLLFFLSPRHIDPLTNWD